MATRTATVTAVQTLRGPDASIDAASKCAIVEVFFNNQSGGTVIGGTDTLRLADVGASIAAVKRDGKTYTLRAAVLGQLAVESAVAYAATLSLSSNQVDLTPKSTSDYSTNATLPATYAGNPFSIICHCTVS